MKDRRKKRKKEELRKLVEGIKEWEEENARNRDESDGI